MKFFAVAAASLALVGSALAQEVVYETEVVTITSCPPEKVSCPGTVVTSYSAVPTAPVSEEPAVTTSVPAEEVIEPTDCPESTGVATVTVPVCPGDESCPPLSTGTGAPVPSANATVPVITPGQPTPSNIFEGSAATKGVSFFAVAGAALFAIFA